MSNSLALQRTELIDDLDDGSISSTIELQTEGFLGNVEFIPNRSEADSSTKLFFSRFGELAPGTEQFFYDDKQDFGGYEKVAPRISPVISSTSNNELKLETIKQVWNGTILEIKGDIVQVRLEDITSVSAQEELVSLSVEEFSKEDKSLIQEGALFLWHIGYTQGYKKPKQRFSKIRLRRLPSWTEKELLSARKLAAEDSELFNAHINKPS